MKRSGPEAPVPQPRVGPRHRPLWRVLRWLLLILIVLAGHATVAVWLARIDAARPAYPTTHAPVEIAILTARAISAPSAQPAANARATPADADAATPDASPQAAPAEMQAIEPLPLKKTAVPRPQAVKPSRLKPAQPATATASEAASSSAATDAASAANADAAQSAEATHPDARQIASGASGVAGASPASQALAGVTAKADAGEKFSLPASVDLQFDSFYNGVQNPVGTLRWQTDGHHYRMVVSIPLPFIGLFSFTSEGDIDQYGLAPDRYAEQRGRRPPDETRLERHATPPRITFTRTTATLPLPEPVQDRLSMMMQLAALVRGDPGRYQPGVTRQFAVVDNNSGEIWAIETIGRETVQTRVGPIEAVHFMRLARRAGDQRRLDIWLSESLGWLPARIMQTEPNGSQIELVWRGAPHSVDPANPEP